VTPVLEAPPRRPRSSRTNGRIPPPPPTGGDDGPDRDPASGPRLLDNVVLATVFVIAGEIMFFAGLIFSFWVVRLAAPVWPPPLEPRLPVAVTAVNTVVLLFSSWAMTAGLRARTRHPRAFVRGLAVAAALGGLFLVVQGYEWFRLVHFGITLSSGAYGATFYTLVGFHAAHVVAALAWLGAMLVLAARGRFAGPRAPAVTACAMYWHFVVALWPILYVSVYLL